LNNPVDPLGLVFGALADPSRRQVIGYLSERGTATATELTGELPMTRQAVAETGLLQQGSRATERYLLKIDTAKQSVADTRAEVEKILPDAQITDFREACLKRLHHAFSSFSRNHK